MTKPGFTVTLLADNVAEPPFREEHGFSACLETADPPEGTRGHILFDVGRGALLDNAPAAGLALEGVSDIVLSHGHYDHTDALPAVLSAAPGARVHASEGIFDGHWSARTGALRPIGLSAESRAALEERASGHQPLFQPFRGRKTLSGTPFHLAEGIPRLHPLETPSPLLFSDPEGLRPDPVSEELALWANTPEGLVILTGCCHGGLINTCEYVRSLSGESRIRAVIGGFHLAGVSEERLEATADYLCGAGVSLLVPCHCTGAAETDWLRVRLGEFVESGACGLRIEL